MALLHLSLVMYYFPFELELVVVEAYGSVAIDVQTCLVEVIERQPFHPGQNYECIRRLNFLLIRPAKIEIKNFIHSTPHWKSKQ